MCEFCRRRRCPCACPFYEGKHAWRRRREREAHAEQVAFFEKLEGNGILENRMKIGCGYDREDTDKS